MLYSYKKRVNKNKFIRNNSNIVFENNISYCVMNNKRNYYLKITC